MMQLKFSSQQPPTLTLIVGSLTSTKLSTTSVSSGPSTLVLERGDAIQGDFAIARYLARLSPNVGLYSSDPLEASRIDSFIDVASSIYSGASAETAAYLNSHLQVRTYMAGYAANLSDFALFVAMKGFGFTGSSSYVHLTRWFNHISEMPAVEQALAVKAPSAAVAAPATKQQGSGKAASKGKNQGKNQGKKDSSGGKKGGESKKEQGGFQALEGVKMGDHVMTRFPPEPSGFLHIGHVKAIMLNYHYAKHYGGKLLLRFDDTNPSNEKDEFTQAIIEDLARLEVTPDYMSHTSDHFDLIQYYAEKLVKDGNAYMDDTPTEQMREERWNGVVGARRNESVQDNLQRFHLMLTGKGEAEKWCLRAKINMSDKNRTMRDPVLYRVNLEPHARTGTKYKAYPTYDMACPVVDSVEGVTHAMRDTAYSERDEQYAWMQEKMGVRKVFIQEFSRLNFKQTLMSKRKLGWFVEQGKVWGWNDPRCPTVQGSLRRGMSVAALRDFILSQGFSKRVVDMEWDKLWSMNTRLLDPVAPRYMAIMKDSAVEISITNVGDGITALSVPLHPKDKEGTKFGHRTMLCSSRVYVESGDASTFAVGEQITLMRWGNVFIRDITKDASGAVVGLSAEFNPEGTVKETKKRVTWISNTADVVPTTIYEFDHLINKAKLEDGDDFKDFVNTTSLATSEAFGDAGMRNLQEGDIIQVERRGYFRCDRPYINERKPLVLFMIPDGKSKSMSTLATKLAHR